MKQTDDFIKSNWDRDQTLDITNGCIFPRVWRVWVGERKDRD